MIIVLGILAGLGFVAGLALCVYSLRRTTAAFEDILEMARISSNPAAVSADDALLNELDSADPRDPVVQALRTWRNDVRAGEPS